MTDSPGNIFTSLLQPPTSNTNMPLGQTTNQNISNQQTHTPSPAPTTERNSHTTFPTPPSQQETHANPSTMPGRNSKQELSKPLDVTDALSYLDLVKVQFENLPTTYNKFLDVMKDFKSSAIDTPGVIERVSTLFQGFPNLIQGFNTFLPPGYRIECGQDPTVIIVTTPSGTSTRAPTSGNTHTISNPYQQDIEIHGLEQRMSSKVAPDEQRASLPSQLSANAAMESSTVAQNVGSISAEHPRGPSPSIPANPSPGVATSASNAATVLGGMNSRLDTLGASSGTGQVNEFHHAMTYINRIKTRFVENQEVYKEFLQLLQAYQKEQMSIQEAYHQVAILFKNAEELLEEFKLFLPDTSQQGVGLDLAQTGGSITGTQWQAYGISGEQEALNRRRNDIPLAQKRKRRQPEKEAATTRGGGGRRRRQPVTQGTSKMDLGITPNEGFSRQAGSPTDAPHSLHASSVHQPTSDERLAAFFEHLKHSMEEEDVYDEFLKVLEMFSLDILDADTLLERLNPFLSHEEMDHFLELLGWDDDRGFEEGGGDNDSFERRRALGALKQATTVEPVARVGPSYRGCPVVETGLACSGRDELCHSVLNDKWESHPTWASEESGFISHKKNAFEEALYRSEEERYEYQFHIEAMGRTLSLLGPLLRKLEETSTEGGTGFRVFPGLGSTTPSIHERILKKVYGREAGLEIIQALYEAPSYALPVVLPRLKQKDEEWRRGQTEFNKMWRDVDNRNFYKSLDHMGITFKANDKKAITTKALVGQIESARVSVLERGIDLLGSDYHLDFTFSDLNVVRDAMKLCFCALDRQPMLYNRIERRCIERFMRSLVPLILKEDFTEFDAAIGSPFPSVSYDEMDSDGEVPNVPDGGDGVDGVSAIEPLLRIDESWISLDGANSRSISEEKSGFSNSVIYTNTSIYIVIRLLQMVFSRLLSAKEVSRTLGKDKTCPWVANPVAVELGIHDNSWSSTAAAPKGGLGQSTSPDHFYQFLLSCVEKLFDGELEQSTFEDCARVTFGTQAYKLFTIDKVIGALNKQVQTIVCDGRASLLSLQEQSAHCNATKQERVRYRIRAEIMANSDENVYEVTTRGRSGEVMIRLLRKGDLTPGTTAEELYTESFLMDYPTGSLSQTPRLPYLRRCLNICAENGERRKGYGQSKLSIKFGEHCKIQYKGESEETLTQVHSRYRLQSGIEQSKARRTKWLSESYI